MQVSMTQEGGVATQAAGRPGDLAQLLAGRSRSLAAAWRRRYYGSDPQALSALAQLDGVVEPLLAELGTSLATLHDLPASAWGRTSGVLRLSHARGAEGLHGEFQLLTEVLEEAAAQLRAAPAQRKRMRVLLDASQAQALALLGRCTASPGARLPPAGRFGGVVVETL